MFKYIILFSKNWNRCCCSICFPRPEVHVLLQFKTSDMGKENCCVIISHNLKFSLFECSTSVKSIHVLGLQSTSCHWSTAWDARSIEPNNSSARKQKERAQSYFSLGITQLLANPFTHCYSRFSCSVAPKALIAINCVYTFEQLFTSC